MQLKPPASYTNEPGILLLEPGDPSIDEIKRVFRSKGLKVTQQSNLDTLEVTIDIDSISFSKGILCLIISKPTYIEYKSIEAMDELREAKA